MGRISKGDSGIKQVIFFSLKYDPELAGFVWIAADKILSRSNYQNKGEGP